LLPLEEANAAELEPEGVRQRRDEVGVLRQETIACWGRARGGLKLLFYRID